MVKKMTKGFLILTLLTIGLCIYADPLALREAQKVASPEKSERKGNTNLRFTFTAERQSQEEESIDIAARLYNDHADTVYLLTSTCEGEQYSLCYDTAKFKLMPRMLCNASYPKLIKIPPFGKHDFQTQFRSKRDESNMRLGFDFYSVDASFNIDKITLDEIHGRQGKEKDILWFEGKIIK
jgi:hypothetical protein